MTPQTTPASVTLDMSKDHLVQALHEHFDQDKDSFLNFNELAALQLATAGETMSEDQYVMVCRMLQCQPAQGISLTALRLTYASQGTNVENDYTKVFGKAANDVATKKDHEDDVYEVGADGVDISS